MIGMRLKSRPGERLTQTKVEVPFSFTTSLQSRTMAFVGCLKTLLPGGNMMHAALCNVACTGFASGWSFCKAVPPDGYGKVVQR